MHVWVAPLDVPLGRYGWLVASLSATERARAERYRFPRHARRFSAGRGWLRHVLGAELGVPAAAVRLGENGAKPHLLDDPGLHFNMSHAAELAVIAVASRPVGIDVEPVAHMRFDPGLVGLACTSAEAEELDRLPVEEQAVGFLRIWTAKEAYLKATGAGLSVPPSSVHVGSNRPAAGVAVQAAGDPGAARWWVRDLEPADGYIGAVATEGPGWEVVVHSTAVLTLEGSAEEGG
ncbi:MAG: 4'-phosphopantetheinyl transferase family protein [Acidimicrobiales bacterium]